MKNILKYPTLILFAVFIMGFTIMDFISEDREFSELENRVLSQSPTLTVSSLLSNEYTLKYETYINDQFFMRDEWITIKSVSEALIGKVENNGIVYGSDDYMFDKYITLDEERVSDNINYVQEFIDKYPTLPMTIALIPNSYEVLSDKLPAGLNNIDQDEYIGKIFDGLYGTNVEELSFTEALTAHKDEYIYYRTDHHWSTLGAYYAYEEYINSKGLTPVSLNELNENDVHNFYGTYFSKSKDYNAVSDIITWYDIPITSFEIEGSLKDGLYDFDKFVVTDKYASFIWGNNGLTVIKSENADDDNQNSKILVIKDSYANSFVPFLTYNFDEVHVIDLRHFVGSMSTYLEQNSFDDILLMYNFKNFAEDINIPKLRY